MLVREILRVGADHLVSRRNVEGAVGTEVDRAAVVEIGGQIGVLPDHHLGGRVGGVPHHGQAPDPIPRLVRRVVGVEVAVRRKVWVERQADEAALPVERVGGELDERQREQAPVLHRQDPAAPFAHEEPSVGSELEHRRLAQSADDGRALEARGESRLGGPRPHEPHTQPREGNERPATSLRSLAARRRRLYLFAATRRPATSQPEPPRCVRARCRRDAPYPPRRPRAARSSLASRARVSRAKGLPPGCRRSR